jgi:hypothetical protein
MAESFQWKGGVAKTEITPTKSMWLHGIGWRDRPSEGTLNPLFLKILALQDSNQKKAVIMSFDLLGITKPLYERVVATLSSKFQLDPSQVLLHTSHTHSGPVISGRNYDGMLHMTEPHYKLMDEYTAWLETKIIETTEKALEALTPAFVYAGQGQSHFAVNRRQNPEADVEKLRFQGKLKGPVDHSVPVLTVRDLNSHLVAVVFGYACHNTTLGVASPNFLWSGDYAGFAQIALERNHPGMTAMFFMGCGADQNPLPRGQVYLAQRYGEMLAAAVEEVLLSGQAKLTAVLEMKQDFSMLPLGPFPPEDELKTLSIVPPGQAREVQHIWAARLLKELKEGKEIHKTCKFPVNVWRLGRQQVWISLGYEVVIDYAIRFKLEFGANTWVSAYTNYVEAYVASHRVILEDKLPPRGKGYEGNTSMYSLGQPAHRWAEEVEHVLALTVRTLVNSILDSV